MGKTCAQLVHGAICAAAQRILQIVFRTVWQPVARMTLLQIIAEGLSVHQGSTRTETRVRLGMM